MNVWLLILSFFSYRITHLNGFTLPFPLPLTFKYKFKFHSNPYQHDTTQSFSSPYLFSFQYPFSFQYHQSNIALYDKSKSKSNLNDIILECNETFQHPDRISMISPTFRSGFISIVGKPNMGKSTLLNALLQQNLSVSTHRPQTTRHSILGIVSNVESQVQLCFLDTPGMISNPAYKLQEGMMEAVKGAVRDADLILVMTDLESEYNEWNVTNANHNQNYNQNYNDADHYQDSSLTQEDYILTSIQKTNKPIIVIINKCDLASKLIHSNININTNTNTNPKAAEDILINQIIDKWRQLLPKSKMILPCSAKQKDIGFQLLQSILLCNNNNHIDLPSLFRQLGKPRPGMFPTTTQMWLSNDQAKELIPLSPPMYPMDTLTDRSERFFASEIIRGSIFVTLGKEVPYCCEVRIQQFKEPTTNHDHDHDNRGGGGGGGIRIQADILVERDSQKGIVVGKGGKMIKTIGMDARKKLETFLDNKVFLELSVKIDKKWRRNEDRLREYGYWNKK